MLMLTHSWLLAHYLGKEKFNRKLQDLYVYNICPDFLPAGPVFSPRLTHGAPRFRPIPPEFQGANFIVFHLMVDDISHYGLIKARPDEEFNPDAEGYSYLKGIPLRGPLMDFHQTYGNPIDLAQAAYQSHMVIEMTFDLALYWGHRKKVGRSSNTCARPFGMCGKKKRRICANGWLVLRCGSERGNRSPRKVPFLLRPRKYGEVHDP